MAVWKTTAKFRIKFKLRIMFRIDVFGFLAETNNHSRSDDLKNINKSTENLCDWKLHTDWLMNCQDVSTAVVT